MPAWREIHRSRSPQIIPLMAAALATGAGCAFDANVDVRTDPRWTEITPRRAVFRRPAAPPRAAKPPARPVQREPAARPAPARRPLLAVFNIEDRGSGISAEILERLSDYLGMRIAATAQYQVVPRDQLKERLKQQKLESYKRCYTQSCQIELGKELAAQKSLSTTIIRLGSGCAVTAVLYDLSRAASEGGANAEGSCDEQGVVGAIKRIVEQLTRGR